jgi:hypothetical protein
MLLLANVGEPSAGLTLGLAVLGIALTLIAFLGKRAVDAIDLRQGHSEAALKDLAKTLHDVQSKASEAQGSLQTAIAVLTEKVSSNNGTAVLNEKVDKLEEEVRDNRHRFHKLSNHFQTMLLRLATANPALGAQARTDIESEKE